MHIKLDENLPELLAVQLRQMGHDVSTIPEEGLAGAVDSVVWAAAQHEARFLITQDLDFSNSRQFAPGTHAGILIVRLKTPGRAALTDFVSTLFATEDTSTWAGCFLVATERKLRIQRP